MQSVVKSKVVHSFIHIIHDSVTSCVCVVPASGVREPPEAPRKSFKWGPIFPRKKLAWGGGLEKQTFFEPYSSKKRLFTKNFRIMSTKKRDPNFTIPTILALYN